MKLFASVATIAALTAGAALAQDVAFTDVDANADGLLSLEEVQGAAPEVTEDQFNTYDADVDGFLNQEEFTAWTGSSEPAEDEMTEQPY